MSDPWQTSTDTHFNQLVDLVPWALMHSAVDQYLTREREERARNDRGGKNFPPPSIIARKIIRDTLEPKLVERLGETGRTLARFIVRATGVYFALHSTWHMRTQGKRRYDQKMVVAETDFACREFVRAWVDALLILGDDDTKLEGEIKLDALLFPKTHGVNTEPLGGSVPDTFKLICPDALTWRDVFLSMTSHLALDDDAKLEIWRKFAFEAKLLIDKYESHPCEGFLLVHIDSERTWTLRYMPEDDRYYFIWHTDPLTL